jgi:hypothetical protein
MKIKIILASISLVLVGGFVLSSFSTKKKFSINGAWSIVEVETVKPDGTKSTTFPKASMALFADKHYSFCWTSHSSTIRSWELADSVKVNRFNQSIVNTGTFTLKDSILTTKANFAMSIMFTNGIAKFKCSFSGDTLILNGLSVFSSENIAHPAYANGLHFVSKLVRIATASQ